MKKTPVRIVHGDSDALVIDDNSRYIVDKMRKGGATDVKLDSLKGEGHAIYMSWVLYDYTDRFMQGKY